MKTRSYARRNTVKGLTDPFMHSRVNLVLRSVSLGESINELIAVNQISVELAVMNNNRSVVVVVKDIAGGLTLNFWADQIEHRAANGSPPLGCFFF